MSILETYKVNPSGIAKAGWKRSHNGNSTKLRFAVPLARKAGTWQRKRYFFYILPGDILMCALTAFITFNKARANAL